MGGLPTALAELPATTTVLLRAIQDVAVAHGFDPAEPGVQYDCIQVFSAAGPLDHDDGADLAFLSTRMAVTGTAVQALITRVAPRLATVLGQKLAAQTVPVLGAAAGAATNYAYTSYYQQMAHVHFGLRRLAIDADRPHEVLVEEFRARLSALRRRGDRRRFRACRAGGPSPPGRTDWCPASRAAWITARSSFRSVRRRIDLTGPIEAGRIDSVRSPIAAMQAASTGRPASSPQKLSGAPSRSQRSTMPSRKVRKLTLSVS